MKMFIMANTDSVEKIQNPNNVNFIRSARDDNNKLFLIAGLNTGEVIEISKKQSMLSYPFEPVLSFLHSHFDDTYRAHFGLLNNDTCFNINTFEKFEYQKSDEGHCVAVVAHFNDGNSHKCFDFREKHFEKEKGKLESFERRVQSIRKFVEEMEV